MSKIGYVRVSTVEQNTDRQEIALKEIGVDRFFIEKASGKNAQRIELKRMLDYIREDDTVYIESISRLARSTKDLLNIVQQLQEKKVDLISLKENIDTTTPQGKFILTVFGALSELERENILQRQREGIDAARLRGKKFGRPQIVQPREWEKVITLWMKEEITAVEAMKRLKMNRGTFYRRVKDMKNQMENNENTSALSSQSQE